MVVSGLDSGMGNQMFQYAAGYGVARERGDTFYIDISQFKYNPRPYGLSKFQISAEMFRTHPAASDGKLFRAFARMERIARMGLISVDFYKEKKEWKYGYHKISSKKRNIYLSGFWQNYKYFDEYKEDIIREFTIREGYIGDAAKKRILEVMNTDSVAIHIRRGDYLECDGWLLPDSYYIQAIQMMFQTVGSDLSLFVFCEDAEYVKGLFFEYDYQLVTDRLSIEDIEEFWIMKSCKHHIISNSTYSWWAAYLRDDGEVLAPVFKNWTADYYPDGWQLIDCSRIK